MGFSARTAWEDEDNAFAALLRKCRELGRELLDLTRSNPLECGLGPQADTIFPALTNAAALQYEPNSLGLTLARNAVADYYGDAGVRPNVGNICLTTSTSEGYSFLFRLLCDPGDEVLVARPSYPLFDSIARLDNVVLREYPLFYDPGGGTGEPGWLIDLVSLENSITDRTRAIVVVHPNNPTGHYASEREQIELLALCARHDLALIADEVFLDYSFDGWRRPCFLAQPCSGLCFVLSGLSKVCGLPQMKASWIVAHGLDSKVSGAMRRLEIVADTYLSMNAPIQLALPAWLRHRATFQRRVGARVAANLGVLQERVRGTASALLAAEGGWTAVLRVPRTVDGRDFGEAALDRGVVVQPGSLYGLPEGRIVLSLLTEADVWGEGLERLPL